MDKRKTTVKRHNRKSSKLHEKEVDRQEPRPGISDLVLQPRAPTWTGPFQNTHQPYEESGYQYPMWGNEQQSWAERRPDFGYASVAQARFAPPPHCYEYPVPVDRPSHLPPGSVHPSMALPGHSPPPPPFGGPGSPSRSLSGFPDVHTQYPMYGPSSRPMPPPSPHSYPPRYSQGPPPPPPPPPPPSTALSYQNDNRGPPLPHKRPGSSMSISSMLGSEPEKSAPPLQDPYYQRLPPRPHSTTGPPMALGAVMSPPQYPPRPVVSDYTYKPRSRTPDRLGDSLGTRPSRSSSGSLMQRPGPFQDHANGVDQQPQSRFAAPAPTSLAAFPRRDETTERARRTSINGILQRPDSDLVRPSSTDRLPQSAPTASQANYAMSATASTSSFGPSKLTALTERATGLSSSYDTRPPALSTAVRTSLSSLMQNARDSNSRSPEIRRSQPNGTEPRSLAGLLNNGPEGMHRQDSEQSRSSAFGDRYKARAFSPFAGSVASQTMSSTSVPVEDSARKGSDELSQHRAILAIAADAKRGRYSPVPQAVQGAQAQTPVPDSGIKSEHGRVFAGLGGGLGSSSTGPTSTPVGLAASPFKQNDAARLSEENLMKVSRSTSGVNKRSRKYDEEIRAESDIGDGKKSGSRKKSKYAHSYKIDLENEVNRRDTPLSTANGIRSTAAPTSSTNNGLHHHHQLQRQPVTDPLPLFKPKKTVRMSSIITAAKRYPRRHIGNFIYDPEVANSDAPRLGFEKFDFSIKPNLLPSFNDNAQTNCTYSVRVPKMWLQERERSLICKEAYLWGSGIYTDDSDVVAAAMHSGYIQSQAPEIVDKVLLSRVVRDQNTKIEGLFMPEKPLEPEAGKDAIITLVVLPPLDQYVSSSRFGMSSREWPEKGSKTPHDGVSFAILKVDMVTGGVEGRRMGRTGVEKRKRMQREQQERLQSQLLLKRMLEEARKKLKEQGKQSSKEKKKKHPLSEAMNMVDEVLSEHNVGGEIVPAVSVALDVGHTPAEWLKQVEVEAI